MNSIPTMLFQTHRGSWRQLAVLVPGVVLSLACGCSRQSDQAADLVRFAQARQDAGQHEDALILLDRALALKPDFAAALHARGISSLRLNRIDDAEEQVRQALRHQSDDAETWWTLATIQRMQNRPNQAIDSLSRAIRLDRSLTDAWYDRACLHTEQQRWRDAAGDLDVVIRQNPAHGEARLKRAGLLRSQGNADAALVDLGRAIQANPGLAAAWFERAQVYRQQREPAHALADATVACRLAEDNIDYRQVRADLLMELQRFQEAGEDYDRIAGLQPDAIEPVLGAAAAFEQAEKPIRATACLNTAIRLQPDRADLYRRRARLLKLTGDLSASREDLARVQQLDPEDREAGLELMRTHVAEGRPEMALHISERLIEGARLSDLLKIRELRARLLENVGRPEDAIREYGLLAEQDSCRIHALTQKSGLHIQAEQWQPAANDLTVLLAARPDDHELRMLRATAWEKLGRNAECIEDLSVIINDQPDSSIALNLRSKLLLEMKRVDAAIADLTQLRRLHPDDSSIQLKLADLCLLNGQYDRVFGAVSDVPEADPNAAALFYLRGAAHFEQHQAVEARDWLTRAIQVQEDHTDARMLRAILMLDADEPQKALDDLQIVASKTEPGPELLELRAQALLKTGDVLQALNDLDSVLRQRPDALDARRLRCRTRLKTGDIEGAIDDATFVLKSDPTDRDIRLLRADAALALKNHFVAAVDYEQLLSDSGPGEDDVDLRWKLCQCRLQTEDRPAVQRELDAILDARPNHHAARIERARIRERAGELELALKDLAELIRSRPNDAEPLISRARIRQRMGNAKMAVEDLTLAISRRDDDAQLYYRRGLVRHQLHEPDAALSDLDQAIRLDETRADYWYVRGNVLAETGNDQQAIEAFERAIERNPNHTAAWYNYGNMQFARDDFDDAIRCWNEAIRIQPDLFRAYHNRAVALTRLDRPIEAADDYETTIVLNPEFVQAYESLAWLLATTDEAKLRDPKGAVALATQACEMTNNGNWRCLSTLAACHAEAENFSAAREAARAATSIAPPDHRQRLAELTQIYSQRAAAESTRRL